MLVGTFPHAVAHFFCVTYSCSKRHQLNEIVSGQNAKATHIFFSKNISIYAIFNDQNFNDTTSFVFNNWVLFSYSPSAT